MRHFDKSKFFEAVREGNVSVVRSQLKLLEDEDLEEICMRKGQTAFHVAANEKIVELLVQHQPEVNLEIDDGDGLKPIHYAAEKGNILLVKYYVEMKVPIDSRDLDGQTPLFYAAKFGHEEIVMMLIARHAKVNAVDNYGFSALHRASEKGHLGIVKLLIKHGADVECKDHGQYGYAAIHFAASLGHLEVVKHLVEEGKANVHSLTTAGKWTAYRSSKHNGHQEIADYLQPYMKDSEINDTAQQKDVVEDGNSNMPMEVHQELIVSAQEEDQIIPATAAIISAETPRATRKRKTMTTHPTSSAKKRAMQSIIQQNSPPIPSYSTAVITPIATSSSSAFSSSSSTSSSSRPINHQPQLSQPSQQSLQHASPPSSPQPSQSIVTVATPTSTIASSSDRLHRWNELIDRMTSTQQQMMLEYDDLLYQYQQERNERIRLAQENISIHQELEEYKRKLDQLRQFLK